MIMKNVFLKIMFLALIITAINACKKETVLDDIEAFVASSQNNGDTENLSQGSDEDADDEIETAASRGGTCPTITFASPKGTYPNTITVDYGTTGCAGAKGRIRKGKIIINVSADKKTVGATRVINFSNFSIDDVKIEGTRTWTYTGKNPVGQPTWTRTMANGKLTFTDGTFTTWSASHFVTMLEGFDTDTHADNKLSITGGSNGVNHKGNAYTATITTPIIRTFTCKWPLSGVRSIEVNGKARSIDYSYSAKTAGDCDNEAMLTFANGTTRVIQLRK
jgi:hypothetical protein